MQGEGNESEPTPNKMSGRKTATNQKGLTTMKKQNLYTINAEEKTIVLTKKFDKSARIYGTPEYRLLTKIRRDNPDYEVVVRTIEKAKSKNTYSDLTIDKMSDFIANVSKDSRPVEERLKEFDETLAKAKCHAGWYGIVKGWFVRNYGEEYNDFGKTEKPEVDQTEDDDEDMAS